MQKSDAVFRQRQGMMARNNSNMCNRGMDVLLLLLLVLCTFFFKFTVYLCKVVLSNWLCLCLSVSGSKQYPQWSKTYQMVIASKASTHTYICIDAAINSLSMACIVGAFIVLFG